jgi:hypothetical protein
MGLLKIIVAALATTGDKANGKKFWIGVVATVAGVGSFWTPAAPVAKELVTAGLTLMGVGLIHKAQKHTDAAHAARQLESH